MQTKILAAAISMAAAAALAGSANAAHFVGNYSVTANTSSTGLQISTQDLPGGIDFNLNSIGQTASEDLFKIYTNETDVDADDLVGKAIKVMFSFTSPVAFSGSVNGTTTGVASGWYENGHVTWADPVIFNYTGGRLQVTLNDADFNKGKYGLDSGSYDGAKITANFKLLGAAVPEPTTWAMMIVGFFGVGAMVRSSRRKLALA